MSKRWLIPSVVLLLVVITAGAMGFWLGYRNNLAEHESLTTFLSALDVKTQLLPRAPVISTFSLLDHQGRPFTSDNFGQKWNLLFFGYTYCPDVCPNALWILNKIYTSLAELEEARNVQIIFVSVDPARDPPEQLARYLSFFNKNFIGLTGESSQIDALAHSLGVAYRRVAQNNNPNSYLIDHSASILLVDPLGRFRATFLPPLQPEKIASDFRKIQAYYAADCCLPSESPKATFIKGRTD